MVRYAVDSLEKDARRVEILRAASALFKNGNGRLPSVATIAEKCGLAKGTVYLYFGTKEEIFAALVADGWGAILSDARTILTTFRGSKRHTVAAFIDAYVGHVCARRDLLQLDALGYGVLERNIAPETLSVLREASICNLTLTGTALDMALGLDENRGLQLLTRTYAMTRGLWQSLHRCDDLATQETSHLGAQSPDFRLELNEALREYWRGALGWARK